MKKISSAIYGALASVLAASFALPATAAPMFVPNVPQVSGDVVKVQSPREFRRDKEVRRHNQNKRNRFERRGNRAYYNNHRGYHQRRPGYRQYNGFWFPPAAFIAGAIIGGAMNNNVIVQPVTSAHVQWCYNRYRSYRASDNTFQPYNGPRQRCYSPYS